MPPDLGASIATARPTRGGGGGRVQGRYDVFLRSELELAGILAVERCNPCVARWDVIFAGGWRVSLLFQLVMIVVGNTSMRDTTAALRLKPSKFGILLCCLWWVSAFLNMFCRALQREASAVYLTRVKCFRHGWAKDYRRSSTYKICIVF